MVENRKSSNVLSEESDCLWLILDQRRESITFPTQLLREIDWKTRGFLSRVVGDQSAFSKTVFIPMAGRLPSKLCAIDTVKTFQPETFEKNVKGLKAEKIVVLFESAKVRSQLDAKLFKKCLCVEDQP